jgi:hypothetical protein
VRQLKEAGMPFGLCKSLTAKSAKFGLFQTVCHLKILELFGQFWMMKKKVNFMVYFGRI